MMPCGQSLIQLIKLHLLLLVINDEFDRSEGARRRRNFAQLGLGEIRMAIYRRYAQRLSHAFKQGVRRHGYDHHLMYLVAQGQHKSQNTPKGDPAPT